MDEAEHPAEPGLIDVTDLPIAQLMAEGNPRLLSALQARAADLADPDGVIAAFSSYAAGR